MRHYEFCVDHDTDGRFGAVSCDACTKVKFHLSPSTKLTSICTCRIIPVSTSAVRMELLSLRVQPKNSLRSAGPKL